MKADWLDALPLCMSKAGAVTSSLPSCNLGTQIIGDEIQHIVLAPGWPESAYSSRTDNDNSGGGSKLHRNLLAKFLPSTMNYITFAIAAVGITSALPAPAKVAEFSTPMRGWMTWERCD